MQRLLIQFISLTSASLKMYFRNKTAVFFTMFFPLIFIGIFALISNKQSAKLNIDVIYNSKSQIESEFVNVLKNSNIFNITVSNNYNTSYTNLVNNNNEDILLNITQSNNSKINVLAMYDQLNSDSPQTGISILNSFANSFNNTVFEEINRTTIPQTVTVNTQSIQTKNLKYIDFIIPGIMGFSLMQLGLFSVAFAFTTMKKTGALKRLHATPVNLYLFIIAQSISRIIVGFLQELIIVLLALDFLGFHMYGNIFLYFLVLILGSIVFIGIGLAVAGYAKDENQAAPIANLISLPMMFFSGVFFSSSLLPSYIRNIVQFLPLTFLNNALRDIANKGATLGQIRTDLLGLLCWGVIAIVIAVRLFKWE